MRIPRLAIPRPEGPREQSAHATLLQDLADDSLAMRRYDRLMTWLTWISLAVSLALLGVAVATIGLGLLFPIWLLPALTIAAAVSAIFTGITWGERTFRYFRWVLRKHRLTRKEETEDWGVDGALRQANQRLPQAIQAARVGCLTQIVRLGVLAGTVAAVTTAAAPAPIGVLNPAAAHWGHAASASSGLQSVDWANHTYPNPCYGGPGSVTVTHAKGKTTDNYVVEILIPPYYNVPPPAYGDLTGDGQAEAVIMFGCTGADFSGPYVMVITGDANHQTVLAILPRTGTTDTPEGTFDRVDSAQIANGKLTLVGRGESPQGSHANPDLKFTVTYRWDGSQFVVVNEQASPNP